MKKFLITFLTIILVISAVFSLFSCGERPRDYDEAEVLSNARVLIEKSILLNEIYYGRGIAYTKDNNLAEGYYYPADIIAMNNIGIETLDDLLQLTKDVFSEKLCGIIVSTKLTAVTESDGTIRHLARYYQKYDTLDINRPECLMVYSEADVFLVDTLVYDYSSLKVSDVVGQVVYVCINVTATNADGESSTQQLRIGLFEETYGWRLETPTYARYVDQDYYNELKNQNKK